MPVVPDYLEFHVPPGINPTERRHQSFPVPGCPESLWFRLLWPKIRQRPHELYAATPTFPIFLPANPPKAPANRGIPRQSCPGGGRVVPGPAMGQPGRCAPSYEVGDVGQRGVLNSCHGFLGCPADLFAPDKALAEPGITRTCVKKYDRPTWPLTPRRLEILAYAVLVSPTGSTAWRGRRPRTLRRSWKKIYGRMISRPRKPLEPIGRGQPLLPDRAVCARHSVRGPSKNILFECDNCGEVVFDLMLIQHLVETGP